MIKLIKLFISVVAAIDCNRGTTTHAAERHETRAQMNIHITGSDYVFLFYDRHGKRFFRQFFALLGNFNSKDYLKLLIKPANLKIW